MGYASSSDALGAASCARDGAWRQLWLKLQNQPPAPLFGSSSSSPVIQTPDITPGMIFCLLLEKPFYSHRH